MTLGNEIKRLRLARGLSQAELAVEVCRLSGRNTVSKFEVSRWESDRRSPSPYSMRYLAGALGVDVEDLLSVNRRQFVAASLAVPSIVRAGSRTGRKITLAEVSAIDELTSTIRQLDNEFGGGHVYGIASQALTSRVMPMLQRGTYTVQVGKNLSRTAADLGHLCGWTAYDLRQHAKAETHFNTAFELSNTMGDRAFAGEILAAASHQAIHRRKYRKAVDLAQRSREIAGETGTPALYAESSILEANAWALLARRSDCLKALSAAESSLERATQANTPEWLNYMDSGYLSARFAHCFRDLGEMPKAREYARAAATMSGSLHRTHASNVVMLATTFAESDPDEGSELGSAALDMVLGLQSGRVVEYVKDLQSRLTTAHPGRTSVTEFSDKVTEALGV
jgi:transcriptional regulator with XRE-family HTH domain